MVQGLRGLHRDDTSPFELGNRFELPAAAARFNPKTTKCSANNVKRGARLTERVGNPRDFAASHLELCLKQLDARDTLRENGLMVAGRSWLGGRMRKNIRTGMTGMCAAAFLSVTVAIAAQQPPATPQPTTPPAAPSNPPSTAPSAPAQPAAPTASDSANKITITGCLQPAPPGPTGTAGATDANRDAAGSEKFVLTNVTSVPPKDAGAPSAPAARTYQLIANEAALTPHSGKKLEVTGVLDDQAGGSRAASPATPESPVASAKAPKLIVESGKIVAPTCAE
jgi:hypothetical protein